MHSLSVSNKIKNKNTFIQVQIKQKYISARIQCYYVLFKIMIVQKYILILEVSMIFFPFRDIFSASVF